RAHARARLPPRLPLRRADRRPGAGAGRLPVRVRDLPQPDAEVRRRAARVGRFRQLREAHVGRLLPARRRQLVRLHVRLGRREARPRHGDGPGADGAHPVPQLLDRRAPDPLGRAHRRLGPQLPVDLRLQPRRAELPPGEGPPRLAAGRGLAVGARHRDGVGHRGQRLARLSVLRHLVPRRHEGDTGGDVRGRCGRRGDRAPALPPRDAAGAPEHHHHRRPALNAMSPRVLGRAQGPVAYAILTALLLVVVFPFYWMFVSSLKSEEQMRTLTAMFWPSPAVLDNYRQLLGKTDFGAWYGNSI